MSTGASKTGCGSQRAGGSPLLSVIVGLSETEPGRVLSMGVNRFPPAACRGKADGGGPGSSGKSRMRRFILEAQEEAVRHGPTPDVF